MSSCVVRVASFASSERRGFTEKGVSAHLDASNDDRAASDDRLATLIADAWTVATTSNPRVFDGSKFRLARLDVQPDKVTFHLGITSYRTFMGTNCLSCSQVDEWRQEGRTRYGDPDAFFSHPLGVGALVRTRDGLFVFLRRSQMTSEAQGLLDRPGGHPEPEQLRASNSTDESSLVREIFDSAVREVEDEVGISRSELGQAELIGITYNQTKAGRPSAEFYMECSMTSTEIEAVYRRGEMSEGYESTGIVFLDEDGLKKEACCSSLAPCAVGSVMLFFNLKNEEAAEK